MWFRCHKSKALTHLCCGFFAKFTGLNFKTQTMTISFPKLTPGVHVYVRDDETLQIGLDPNSALMVDAKLLRLLLPLLDGQHSFEELVQSAQANQIETASMFNFLELLESATLITCECVNQASASNLQTNDIQRISLQRETRENSNKMLRRASTEVSIYGAGRLGTTISLLLASSGYPMLRVIDSVSVSAADVTPWGASRIDIGVRRDTVAMQIIERVARGSSGRNSYLRFSPKLRLAILVPDQVADSPWMDPLAPEQFLANDIPHLVAALATKECQVSSIILPGQTPCIRCEYQRHCDIDPAWPRITQQLLSKVPQDLASSSLVMRSALFVVQQIDQWVETEAVTSNQINVIRQNESDVIAMPIDIHPSCGCAWDRVA
jgi:hypothetical protein